MTAPPLWTVDYQIAGYVGSFTGLDVAWFVRASIYDAAESSQSATVTVILDTDARTALRKSRAEPGFASLSQGGVVRMEGVLRDVEWEPVDGGKRTRVTFTLRDAEADDTGTWPSPNGWKPDRRPDDVVSYQVRITEQAGPDKFEWVPMLRREAFGEIPSPSEGAIWPYVFGTPGKDADGDEGNRYPATPAYVLGEGFDAFDVNDGFPIWLVSAGHVDADEVSIWGPAVGNASIEITSDPDTAGPDRLTIYTGTFDASTTSGAGKFVVVVGDTAATATNLKNAINDPTNTIDDIVEARIDATNPSRVLIRRYIAVDEAGNDRFGYQVKIAVTTEATPGTFVLTPTDGTLVGSLESSILDVDHGLTVQHASYNGTEFAWVSAARSDRDNVAWVPEQRYYVSWPTKARSGGAGDVLRDVLTSSSVRVDMAELERLRPILNGYQLAGYVDQPGPPIAFARAQLLPLLPVDLVPGPSGLRPVIQAGTTIDLADPGVAIRAGYGITRGSPCRIVEGDDVAAVVVEYARRDDTGSYSATATVSPDTNPYALLRRRVLSVESVKSDYVHDAATAERIAADRILRRSVVGHAVRYAVTDWTQYGPGGTVELYAGRRVRLTDADLGFEDVPGVIAEVELDAQGMLVTVETIESPIAD